MRRSETRFTIPLELCPWNLCQPATAACASESRNIRACCTHWSSPFSTRRSWRHKAGGFTVPVWPSLQRETASLQAAAGGAPRVREGSSATLPCTCGAGPRGSPALGRTPPVLTTSTTAGYRGKRTPQNWGQEQRLVDQGNNWTELRKHLKPCQQRQQIKSEMLNQSHRAATYCWFIV